MTQIPFLGELFALAAPLCWSIAIILFRVVGERVPPLALNLFKNTLALVVFAAISWALGVGPSFDDDRGTVALLLASGALGIGVSDTLFFMTLNRLGASLQAIVNTTYSPAIILLSFVFLGERLGAIQWLGVLLILSAVLSVSRAGGAPGISGRQVRTGIALGIATSMTQAASIVMIKPLLETTSLVWANVWRMLGGIVAAIIFLPLMGSVRKELRSLAHAGNWLVLVSGSLMGACVAMLFWLGGMKYTQASVASALNQTATLWTFVLAALLLGEPVTRLRLAALGLGVAGVAMVTFG